MKRPGNAGGDVVLVLGKEPVVFSPGKGEPESEFVLPGDDGAILFCLADGTEQIRFDSTGVYLLGEKKEDSSEIWAAIRCWLGSAIITKGRG